jgi:tetratricopeptide (TPR) repeat protein
MRGALPVAGCSLHPRDADPPDLRPLRLAAFPYAASFCVDASGEGFRQRRKLMQLLNFPRLQGALVIRTGSLLRATVAGHPPAGARWPSGRPYDQAIRLARLTNARNTLATTLMNRAIVLKHLGRLSDAQRAANTALDIEKELGRREGIARYWSMVANIAILRGRTKEGLRMLEKAISIQRGLRRREGLADDLESLADSLRDLGRIGRARSAYQESYRYFGLLGNRDRQRVIRRKLEKMSRPV